MNLLKLCPGLYHSRYPATRSTRAPAPGLSDEAKSNKTGEAHVLKNSFEQKNTYSPYLSIYNVCRDTCIQYISSAYIHISYIAVYVCMHIYIYTQLWNHVVYIVISGLSQTSTAFLAMSPADTSTTVDLQHGNCPLSCPRCGEWKKTINEPMNKRTKESKRIES